MPSDMLIQPILGLLFGVKRMRTMRTMRIWHITRLCTKRTGG